jgi:hypothetical protein
MNKIYIIEYQREIERIMNLLNEFPDSEIWVVAKNKNIAEVCWNNLKEYLDANKEPLILSNRIDYIDGFNSQKAIILLCCDWWINPIAFSDIFRMYLKNAQHTFAIGQFPLKIKHVCNKFTNEELKEYSNASSYMSKIMEEIKEDDAFARY